MLEKLGNTLADLGDLTDKFQTALREENGLGDKAKTELLDATATAITSALGLNETLVESINRLKAHIEALNALADQVTAHFDSRAQAIKALTDGVPEPEKPEEQPAESTQPEQQGQMKEAA